MYRRKANSDPTETRMLDLGGLIDIIKNGETNEGIIVDLLSGGRTGWDELTDDLADDFATWTDTSLKGIDDMDIYDTAWSAFINYVSSRLYDSFAALHAENDDEGDVMGDEFIAQLCDLLRGKSLQLTFTLHITGASIQ